MVHGSKRHVITYFKFGNRRGLVSQVHFYVTQRLGIFRLLVDHQSEPFRVRRSRQHLEDVGHPKVLSNAASLVQLNIKLLFLTARTSRCTTWPAIQIRSSAATGRTAKRLLAVAPIMPSEFSCRNRSKYKLINSKLSSKQSGLSEESSESP